MLGLVITLIVIGILLWLVNTYIPMDAKIERILNVVVIIAVVLYVLSAFGVFNTGRLGGQRVPQIGNCSVVEVGL